MLMSYRLHRQPFYGGETHESSNDGPHVHNLPLGRRFTRQQIADVWDRRPVLGQQPSRVSSDDLRASERDDPEKSVSAGRRLTVPQTLKSARHSHFASAASSYVHPFGGSFATATIVPSRFCCFNPQRGSDLRAMTGWDGTERERHLPLTLSNSRFLILP